MRRITVKLVKLLKEKGLTIAFAESMSCGLITHQLNTVKGTSEVLQGSVICYSEDVKVNLLKVPKNLIKKYSAESQQVTDALAKNLGKVIPADIHAAVTGLATDGGSESKAKPVGTVFFTLVFKNKKHVLKKYFKGTPLEIKKASCCSFYKFIFETVKNFN